MLKLKRHLFVDIGLGGEEPKVWLVEECLEKWIETSKLSALLRIFQDRSKFEIVNGIGELSKLG